MGIRFTVRSLWQPEPQPECVYTFDQARILIGRAPGADIRLPHPGVSATHVHIHRDDQSWRIEDRDTTNGTQLNGARLPAGRQVNLRTGDVAIIAGFRLEITTDVIVGTVTGVESTAAFARKLLQQDAKAPDAVPHAPHLCITDGPDQGLRIPLEPAAGACTLGRGDEADVQVRDADVSRLHLRLEWSPGQATLVDLDSKNGLLVEGVRKRSRRLRHGDRCRIGTTELHYIDPLEAELRALADAPDLPLERWPGKHDTSTSDAGASDAHATRDNAAQTVPPEHKDAATLPPATPSAALPPGPAPPPMRADLFVYLMAATVLGLSVIGLFLLLRG